MSDTSVGQVLADGKTEQKPSNPPIWFFTRDGVQLVPDDPDWSVCGILIGDRVVRWNVYQRVERSCAEDNGRVMYRGFTSPWKAIDAWNRWADERLLDIRAEVREDIEIRANGCRAYRRRLEGEVG